ncbi:LacI family DNA-binding transcriptional regulator [Paenibacillus humicola]|uniref:LacI family DNA-binding transcriptional regulator n=1 Tax=Paenibacillus humicola TaxID=3110540 RepID=UPI00237B1B68|nr:LacI family DNA-binding transcriptional regulator [Paenibacillus humicola]
MKNKVTMQDIADKLNLSKNSVSQALTGKDGVSDETRRLVVETAERMGYVYGKNRKSTAGEASSGYGVIALIASDFAFSMKSFFGEIYLSIEKEVKNRGCELIIQSIGQEDARELNLPPFLQNRSVDGILILSHITTDYINAVIDTGIPAVMIDHHDPAITADCILTNNRFSAFEAVKHLAELGHREVGFIGNIDFSPSYYERLEGFRMASRTYGLQTKDEWLVTDAREDSGFVLDRLTGLEQRPTAWFCVNDGLGFMVNSALQQLDLKVPDDVSVVSFDNGYLSRLSTPQITTVDIDLRLYGVYAVERLFSRIARPDQLCTETLLPTTLLVRGSSSLPKSAGRELPGASLPRS